MLPKKQRIHLGTENFSREDGTKKIRSNHCLWFFRSRIASINSEKSRARFGVSVSAKTAKRAAVRNALRRQLQAAIPQKESLQGYDIICIVVKRPQQIKYILDDLETFIEKAQLK